MGRGRKRMDTDIPIGIKGELSYKRLNPVQKRAYSIYTDQKRRCQNTKRSSYKNYGKKGISVKYSRSEFILWYQNEIKNFQGDFPSVGRIDHDKGYSFDNIRIESISQNSHERRIRLKDVYSNKPVGLFSKKTKECIATFSSMKECAKRLDIPYDSVKRSCRGMKTKLPNSWYYALI